MSRQRLARCIVIEVDEARATAAVLTDDGVFAEVSLFQLPPEARSAGAVAQLPHPDLARSGTVARDNDAGRGGGRRTVSRLAGWVRTTAAAAALVLVAWGGTAGYSVWAYPYELAIDVNPSLTLTLDRELRVHEVRPRNESGRQMAAEQELPGLEAHAAVDRIVAWALRLERAGAEPQAVRVALHQRAFLPAIVANHLPDSLKAQVLPASLHAERLAGSIHVDRQRVQRELYVVVQELERTAWQAALRAGISPNDWALGLRESAQPDRDELLRVIRQLHEELPRDQQERLRRYIRSILPSLGDDTSREDPEEGNDERGEENNGLLEELPDLQLEQPQEDEVQAAGGAPHSRHASR